MARTKQKAAPKKTATTRSRSASISLEYKSQKQKDCAQLIHQNVISFVVGAPGTGKTLLAIYVGLKGLLERRYEKLILSRPTISAGPEIGFLPGTEEEKMAPFLVPLVDALRQFIPQSLIDDLIASGRIEIASISFMRGRNFENAYVVIDESENLTKREFYLLLTRVCRDSKLVFTGDKNQSDIPNSGLDDAIRKLAHEDGFGHIVFGEEDCQRDPIVKTVIRAYGGFE